MSGMAETESGLIVPARLARDRAAAEGAAAPGPVEAEDQDGRRRVVLTREERKLVDRTIKALKAKGLGVLIGCRQDVKRAAGKTSCGEILQPEGFGADGQAGPDHGHGCKCTRVHFR